MNYCPAGKVNMVAKSESQMLKWVQNLKGTIEQGRTVQKWERMFHHQSLPERDHLKK